MNHLKKIKHTISFIIVTTRGGINFIKEVKKVHRENCIILMQESNGTISLVGGLEKLILLKRPYNPM
jgi:hypothetical protein